MKVFISSDIEGTTGIAAWDETESGGFWYEYFREQMSKECAAACKGAIASGAEEILVKDAHSSARNIIPSYLPEKAKINRGWSEDGYSMMSGIQDGYDAVLFTGYHSSAYNSGNPLAHTISNGTLDEIKINGKKASEFMINAYIAGMHHTPVVFLSGDEEICSLAKEFIPGITTVAVNKGKGNSVTSIHPELALRLIEEKAKETFSGNWKDCTVKMPEKFTVTIRYKKHQSASANSLYPNVKQIDEKTIEFITDDFMEVLRLFHFVI